MYTKIEAVRCLEGVERLRPRYLQNFIFYNTCIIIRVHPICRRFAWDSIASLDASPGVSKKIMRMARLELARLSPHAPQACVSTDSTTSACFLGHRALCFALLTPIYKDKP